MLTDGIELLGQSTAANFAIASGTSFPDGATGKLFYKVGNGLHVYDGSAWVKVGAGADITSAAVTTALGYTPAALQNGKIITSQIPAIAITDTFVVASQAAMLALTDAEVGDVAVRTDTKTTFILKTAGAGTLANWVQLLSPGGDVTSVNGQTGVVVLTSANIAEGSNLYFTNARARGAISVTGSGGSYDASTGVITINQSASVSGLPLDIAGSCIGKPIAATAVMRFVANRAFTLPANLVGSIATTSIAATGSTAFSLQKNGTQIGGITYAAGATTGTLALTAATSFAPGDLLTLIAPSQIDATLADFQFTLAGIIS